MHRAPNDAYVYRIDEENGSYSYEFSRSQDEIDFDSYSFGLIGYCNPNGNWQDISVHPIVRVTWKVEPVLSEEEQEENELEQEDIQEEKPEVADVGQDSGKEVHFDNSSPEIDKATSSEASEGISEPE